MAQPVRLEPVCTAERRQLKAFAPDYTVIAVPGLLLIPKADGTRSEAFIGVNFSRRIILVIGSGYAGEMKKSIFSVLNYLLPERNVFPMHCSANIGAKGDTALFFGFSGTGKTTLSADPSAALSATTSTAGATRASSTSRADAMPSASS